MKIIDGKKLSVEILKNIKSGVSALPFVPLFCDILVGDNPASVQYVQMKAKTAESVGIRFHKASFPSSISTEELIKEIESLNKMENMCGIIVQLPLPESLDREKVLASIDPALDVDCLGELAAKKFYKSYDEENDLAYPAALASLALLDSLGKSLDGKKIVVLGQGELVGRPAAALLFYRGLNPLIININTSQKEKNELLKDADVIISGIGKAKYIKAPMVKPGVILIDAGTSESSGGIAGDVDLESVKKIEGYVSPVPGGVGPVTVAMLLKNVLRVALKISSTEEII